MRVVIPMAGLGKRLRPHTYSRPKPLVNVAGFPMLKFLLDTFKDLPIEEYVFIVGYLGEQVEQWTRERYPINARFVVQEELIGQAHAVHLAREYLQGDLILVFADTLFSADLSIIQQTDADAVAFVREVEDPRRFGVANLDATGRVTGFTEKPASLDNKNVVIGLYYIRYAEKMLAAIEEQMARRKMTKGEFFLTDAFQIMIDQGSRFVTAPVTAWLDCGLPDTVLETNRWLLATGHDNSAQALREGVAIIPPVYIDPSARISRSVIGPHVAISAGCEVSDSIISDSVIDEKAVVQHAVLTASLIGSEAKVIGKPRLVDLGANSALME